MTGSSYILADVATNGGEALAISQALLIRLAVMLAAGCVTGVFLGFIVRGLKVGSALVGGTLGGGLAAVGFLLAAPMFGETIGFTVAGGLLALAMTLMISHARPCAATADDDNEPDALTASLSSPVPMKTQAAAKRAPKPDPKSDPDPAPSAKSHAAPELDPDPAPADESESEPAPEKTSAPDPSGLSQALLKTAAPESKTAPKEDDEADAPPPESEAPQKAAPLAHQKATKKPSAIPSPPKPNLKPKPTKGSSTSPAWMQDH